MNLLISACRLSSHNAILVGALALLGAADLSLSKAIADEVPPLDDKVDAETRWNTLSEHYFPGVSIADGEGIIALDAPGRAHDAAVVPISIQALDPSRPVNRIHLIVDQNPLPLAGVFEFAEEAQGWKSLETRIRINEYTNVRAVAELADGSLVMASAFVKAAGGCSAPAMADLDAAMARAGKMQLLIQEATASSLVAAERASPVLSTGDASAAGPLSSATIKISHPNNSGMQFDQVSRNYIPAFYVRTIGAEIDGRPLINVETNFSLSENPVVALTYPGSPEAGNLAVHALDSKGNRYEGNTPIGCGS